MFSTEINPGRSSHLQGQKGTKRVNRKDKSGLMQREDTKHRRTWGRTAAQLYQGLGGQLRLLWDGEGQRHRGIFQGWYRQMEMYDNKEIGASFIIDCGMRPGQETPFALCCHHPDSVCCSDGPDAQQRVELVKALLVGPALLHEGVHLCRADRGAVHALPLLYEADDLWAFHFLG